MKQLESRALELSDLISDEKNEIKENPFRFLNLPKDASLAEARWAYINLAKIYHPDVVHGDEKKEVAELAHKRMSVINLAYQIIKSRYNPRELEEIFGYESKIIGKRNGRNINSIDLEGNCSVIIYPVPEDFFLAGPHLEFDFGPNSYDPGGEPWEFRNCIHVNHLFAYFELQRGKRINEKLLEPLFECFNFLSQHKKIILDLLNQKETSERILYSLGLRSSDMIELFDDSPEQSISTHRLKRNLNQILTLNTDPNYMTMGFRDVSNVSGRFEEGKIILKDFRETILSEADYILLTTLAYGPLIK